jgi:hypothetical protein
MIMNSQSSDVHINGKYSDAAQTVGDPIIVRVNYNRDEEYILEPYLNVYLKDSVSSPSVSSSSPTKS